MTNRIQSVLRRTLARVTSLFAAVTAGCPPEPPARAAGPEPRPAGRSVTTVADDWPLPYVPPVFAFSGIDIGPDGVRVRLTPVADRAAMAGMAW